MKTSYLIIRLTKPTSAPPRKFLASVSTTLSITRFSTLWVSVFNCKAFRSCEISFPRQAISFSWESFTLQVGKRGSPAFYRKITIHCHSVLNLMYCGCCLLPCNSGVYTGLVQGVRMHPLENIGLSEKKEL